MEAHGLLVFAHEWIQIQQHMLSLPRRVHVSESLPFGKILSNHHLCRSISEHISAGRGGRRNWGPHVVYLDYHGGRNGLAFGRLGILQQDPLKLGRIQLKLGWFGVPVVVSRSLLRFFHVRVTVGDRDSFVRAEHVAVPMIVL